ncbi:MAG: hypothetical protein US63_C0046G0003 [Candidatus Moranbacteria bacterium GW2011_GWC2_37_8]|nr:MAG: hypothetical protein US63_C0046G0003 [Candidatus Moranbacteria bacterium GW2011_GWC2_37_8]
MKKTLLFSIFSAAIFSLAFTSQAAAYDIYVNQASSSITEDGSQENPFKTISAAITSAATKPSDQRSIFISNGIYAEKLELNESTSLTGEDKSSTIINGNGNEHSIEINKTSSLFNLTVSEGYTGIYVAAGAGATIKSTKILNTEKMGIEIAKSSTSNFEKVTVSDCDISKGRGKGFYINKRRVLIENNDISDNEEEGVDIRARVKGSIKKNTITKNGESGIELVIGSSSLKITGNKIKSNSASGISHQFYKDSKKIGSITLAKNKIQKNDNYGVQCATPSGGDVPNNYWTKSIDLSKNIFSNNGSIFAKRCGFAIAKK